MMNMLESDVRRSRRHWILPCPLPLRKLALDFAKTGLYIDMQTKDACPGGSEVSGDTSMCMLPIDEVDEQNKSHLIVTSAGQVEREALH